MGATFDVGAGQTGYILSNRASDGSSNLVFQLSPSNGGLATSQVLQSQPMAVTIGNGALFDQSFLPGAETTSFDFQGHYGSLSTRNQSLVTGFQSGASLNGLQVGSNLSVVYDEPSELLKVYESTPILQGGRTDVHLLHLFTLAESYVGEYATSSFTIGADSVGSFVVQTSVTPAPGSVGVAANQNQAVVTTGPGQETVSFNGTSQQLLPGQSIQFLDGTLSFDRATFKDQSTHLPQIFRTYEAALGRAPDAAGENVWNGILNQGGSLSDVASGMLQSSEYIDRYGTTTDADFVAQLYQNALGRQPDPAGAAFWTGLLASHGLRENILVGITQSQEAIGHAMQIEQAGVFARTA